jgi:putative peptidoglycan lipid II flippase
MTKSNLFKIAGLIAIVTILSKLVGFGRDVITAGAYGATTVSDAYFYAYQIPALALILLGGLGGPFHTATIAVFSKIIPDTDQKPSQEIQSLLNSFITITAISFLVLTAVIWVFADPIIRLIASGGSQELHNLASIQLKIMAPILLVGGVIGILYGISNVYKEFFFTALSPTVVSIAIIVAILLFKNDTTGIILAWGTLIGAIGQLLIQLPVFLKSGFRYKPELNFSDERLKNIRQILFPAMIGTTIGQINIYIDMFFASQLIAGAWTAIGYANRIFQFPVGIIITALLVPLFPMFSTFVGKKDWESLKYYFHKGLISLWFMSFPILAFIMIFVQDAIKLLFERGQFDAADTIMVSIALIYLAVSIIPYVARDTITRIFYAFDDSKTPFYIAMVSIFIKALLNFLLIKHLGIGAITLSTTIVTLINALLLTKFIKNKIDLEFNKFILPTIKIISATLIMSAIAIALKLYLNSILPDNTLYLALKLSICSIVCLIIYFISCILFKLQAAEQVIAKIKNLITRRTSTDNNKQKISSS